MHLYQLSNGDEFLLGGSGDTYKLKPSCDQEFLATGNLRVENQRTMRTGLLDENTVVTLLSIN